MRTLKGLMLILLAARVNAQYSYPTPDKPFGPDNSYLPPTTGGGVIGGVDIGGGDIGGGDDGGGIRPCPTCEPIRPTTPCPTCTEPGGVIGGLDGSIISGGGDVTGGDVNTIGGGILEGGGGISGGGEEHEHHHGGPYEFSYAVKDEEHGNDYFHNAKSDGQVVTGEYRVLLPDGRIQVVKYVADWKTGFHADVSYIGEVQSPSNPPFVVVRSTRENDLSVAESAQEPSIILEPPHYEFGRVLRRRG